mgnify:CR=1 FL=1
MMKVWLTIASVGITALCAAEAILWLKNHNKQNTEKLFDEFSKGLRDKRKSNA